MRNHLDQVFDRDHAAWEIIQDFEITSSFSFAIIRKQIISLLARYLQHPFPFLFVAAEERGMLKEGSVWRSLNIENFDEQITQTALDRIILRLDVNLRIQTKTQSLAEFLDIHGIILGIHVGNISCFVFEIFISFINQFDMPYILFP